MFASLIFRMPAALRRAGAYLKAFALLEDSPPRATPGPRGLEDAQAAPSRSRNGALHHGLPGATTTASHIHRRPPRARSDRTPPRRPGTVVQRSQPCITPVASYARGPERLPVSRTGRRGSAA